MGEVYHAVHEKLGRHVAVKILGGMSSLNPAYKMRFFNEARLQASLHHPNIATLYDFQERGDKLFIFMEFVDGECLDDLIERKFFSVEESLQIFGAICEAIAFVHAHGIIHRDIKAQNIKLTMSGTPKLLDFGIAKDAYSNSLTQLGKVIGTPHYLAPEQLEGASASPQTDIWALGVLLYKMLTGSLPFDTDSLEALQARIAKAKFPPPENFNPVVPQSVSRIVQRCLCKETARRYQTAHELVEDVRRVLVNEYKLASGAQFSVKNIFGAAASNDSMLGNFNLGKNFSNPWQKSVFVRAGVAAGASVLLLSGLIGFIFWAFSGDGGVKPPVIAVNKPAAPEPKNKPVTVPQRGGSNTGQNRVQVDVIGGKAQVFRNNQLIGTTPLDLEAADGERIDLTLRREGSQDKNVQFEVTSGKKVYTFSLAPK